MTVAQAGDVRHHPFMNAIRAIAVSLLALPFGLAALAADPVPHTYKPAEGYVPNAQTATAIAIAVWGPIYGAEKIASERPYRTRLTNGVWIVEGSLPRGRLGGVAVIEMSKDDGRILRVSHGK